MYLSELFEENLLEHNFKDNYDNYDKKAYALILSMIKKLMDNGAYFSEAVDAIVAKIGSTKIMPLYLNLKNEIKSDPKYRNQIFEGELDEHMAWGRKGSTIVRKYRCTIGPRKGKAVNKPGDCFKAPDVKKRIQLRMTKAKLGKRMARKRKKTMRTNPASKRVQKLNKTCSRKKR